ncbi:MAG: TetR/AcrR family transcriptional regulator, partial [Panacagrimonas sp.]
MRKEPSRAESGRPKTVPAKNARGRRNSHAARLPDPSPGSSAAPAGRRAKVEDVRGRILEAALECFGAFGFAGTSTRAVADRAGTSHPLLIYHFQSKEQLWLTTMQDVIGRYQSALLARFASVPTDDPIAGLRAFIENFVEFSAQTPELHRIMTQQSTQ